MIADIKKEREREREKKYRGSFHFGVCRSVRVCINAKRMRSQRSLSS